MRYDPTFIRMQTEHRRKKLRAKQVFQGLRAAIARVSDRRIVPAVKPVCSPRESEAFRRLLSDMLNRVHQDIDLLQRAIEDAKPYLEAREARLERERLAALGDGQRSE